MRYLGLALRRAGKSVETSKESKPTYANIAQAGKFKHICAMLEREIFLRSVKHVFNRVLREESGETDLLFSSVVSHMLNCILAPSPIVAALDAEKIKFNEDSV